jgi:protease IV
MTNPTESQLASDTTDAIPLTSSLPALDPLPAVPMQSAEPARAIPSYATPTAPAMSTPPPVPPQVIYAAPPPVKSGGSGCLWTMFILTLLALVGMVMLFFVGRAGQSMADFGADFEDIGNMSKPRPIKKFSEALVEDGKAKSGDRIVRIDLDGPIFNGSAGGSLFAEAIPMLSSIKRQLAQATADSKVKAIVLYVNSPGGEVTASDTLYAAVKAAKEKKPVVVFMDSVAASGGYYVAAPASKIIANETTLTGSIGVIMQGYAYHGTMEKVGFGMNTFTSGKFKDTLSGARPMRDDERAYIQGMVDQMYDRFLTVVSEGRKIDKDTLRNGIADGRVMGGKDALAAKLVDQLGYVEDAYSAARELSKAPDAMIVRYRQEVSLFDALGIEAEARSTPNKIELHVPGFNSMSAMQPGQLYYMTPMFAK